MNTAEYHAKSGSKFGKSVSTHRLDKSRVADEVVKSILWRDGQPPTDPLFISDGSSASYVFCHFMHKLGKLKERQVTVFTNNADLQMQVAADRNSTGLLRIESAPGTFDEENFGDFGQRTCDWVKDVCNGQTCVLAVTELDPVVGPCAHGFAGKQLKRAVMQAAGTLIIIADQYKISQPRNAQLRATNEDEWRHWLEKRAPRGELWIVTTKDDSLNPTHWHLPKLKPSEKDTRGFLEIQSQNLRSFADMFASAKAQHCFIPINCEPGDTSSGQIEEFHPR